MNSEYLPSSILSSSIDILYIKYSNRIASNISGFFVHQKRFLSYAFELCAKMQTPFFVRVIAVVVSVCVFLRDFTLRYLIFYS